MYWVPQQVWKDGSVAIIGGGPSLRREQIKRFRGLGYRTIGINDSYQFGVDIDVCFWGDGCWYHGTKDHPGHAAAMRKWCGWKVTCAHECADEPGVFYLLRWMSPRLQPPPYLKWYANSGLTAIGLALMMGAKRIVLLGFDGGPDSNGVVNWHPDNICPPEPPAWPVYHQAAEELVQDLAYWPGGKGVCIWNATPDTKYLAFETADWRTLS